MGVQSGRLPLGQTEVLPRAGDDVVIRDVLRIGVFKWDRTLRDDVVDHAVVFGNAHPVPGLGLRHADPVGSAVHQQVVSHQEPIRVVQVEPGALDVVHDIVVDQVEDIRGLEEEGPGVTRDVVNQVPGDPRVPVREIDPDSRRSIAIVNVITRDYRIQHDQELDACHLPVALDILPTAIMDVIVGNQTPGDDGSLNAARAAIVHMVAAYQMVAGGHRQLVPVPRVGTLFGERADLDTHRVDVPDRVVLDDPMVAPPGRDGAVSGADETVAGMLEREPLDPDVSHPLHHGVEQELSRGHLDPHVIRVPAVERVEVQLPVLPIDPDGAGDPVQLIDPGQLGQSPPVLEHHGSRQGVRDPSLLRPGPAHDRKVIVGSVDGCKRVIVTEELDGQIRLPDVRRS